MTKHAVHHYLQRIGHCLLLLESLKSLLLNRCIQLPGFIRQPGLSEHSKDGRSKTDGRPVWRPKSKIISLSLSTCFKWHYLFSKVFPLTVVPLLRSPFFFPDFGHPLYPFRSLDLKYFEFLRIFEKFRGSYHNRFLVLNS